MKHESKAGIIGRRWCEEVWSQRRDDLVDELMTPDSIGHVEGGEYRGPAGFRQMREMFLSALPDVHIVVEDVISDGDRAAVRWRARGTHTGHGFGFAPTHERIESAVRRGSSFTATRSWKGGTRGIWKGCCRSCGRRRRRRGNQVWFTGTSSTRSSSNLNSTKKN